LEEESYFQYIKSQQTSKAYHIGDYVDYEKSQKGDTKPNETIQKSSTGSSKFFGVARRADVFPAGDNDIEHEDNADDDEGKKNEIEATKSKIISGEYIGNSATWSDIKFIWLTGSDYVHDSCVSGGDKKIKYVHSF